MWLTDMVCGYLVVPVMNQRNALVKEEPTTVHTVVGLYKGGTKGGAGSGCREVSSPQTSQLRAMVETGLSLHRCPTSTTGRNNRLNIFLDFALNRSLPNSPQLI